MNAKYDARYWSTLDPATCTKEQGKEATETLLAELEHLNTQLGNKDFQIDGRRATEREYHEWRHRAVGAKNHLMKAYRAYKQRLKEIDDAELSDRDIIQALADKLAKLLGCTRQVVMRDTLLELRTR